MTKNKKDKIQETVTFIKQWAKNPLRMGSLIPSSKFLADRMARCALEQLSDHEVVLELGAGTGRFTQALLEAGLSPSRLICMELDLTLMDFLKHRFPHLSIIQGNAVFLGELLPPDILGRVGVIVSGLPMLSLSKVVQEKILQACMKVLSPTGSLLQMTYGPFSSISAPRYGLNQSHMGCVWWNMPPANIWRYTRGDLP